MKFKPQSLAKLQKSMEGTLLEQVFQEFIKITQKKQPITQQDYQSQSAKKYGCAF
jgi:hypothetical protein